jgi:cellulose synthase/poly-beta-1,6-N-acetylglucosamine synthase-like glycosyltransferase
MSYEVFISLTAFFYFYIAIKRPVKDSYSIKKDFFPKVLVMVPCKGLDIGLERNLKSIKNQKYGNFEILAIVDNEKDIALKVIKKAGLDYITTSKKFCRGSGKVNALSTAIAANSDYDVYVIADSDINVERSWLSKLIAPLADKRVGLSTSYPYFKATGGFWSRVKMVWGFVGNGMLESKLLRFGWGGSLAFRKEIIAGKVARFSRYLSDDIAITDFVKEKGLELAYVPSAAPIVETKDTRTTFWEWANRQTAFSIRGNRKNFQFGVVFYLFDNVLLVSGVLLSIFVSYMFILLLVPRSIGIMKLRRRLRQSCRGFFIIALAMPAIFLVNLLIANNMQSIEWRGRKYSV